MSKLILHPHQTPDRNYFTPLVRPLQAKMDIATNPVLKSFLAGSFSGTCSTILFQPLDLVKTRIQNHHQASLTVGANSNVVMLNARSNIGMFSVVRHVLANEHFTALWRGLKPSVTRTVPGVGLYFGSLHWLKSNTPGGEQPTPLEAICLGMAARSVSGAVMIPITVIKTRFESGTYNYDRMSSALASIYKKEGVRGLTSGLLPTLVRDAPYSGLYLMFYTQLKQHLPALDKNSNNAALNSAMTHFGCGITAGFLASMVTHPADVVKTQMQLHPERYGGSSLTAVTSIFRASGAKGFLVGLAPRMLRRTLMSALAWTVYEEIMRQVGLK